MVKWGSGFESGWYMAPDPEIDPQLEEIVYNKEEDAKALRASEFYDLLKRLVSGEADDCGSETEISEAPDAGS